MIHASRNVMELGPDGSPQKPYTEVITDTTTLCYSSTHQPMSGGLRVMIEAQPPIAGADEPHNTLGDDLYGAPNQMRLLRTDVRPSAEIGHYILEVSAQKGRPLSEIDFFLDRLEEYVDDHSVRDRYKQTPSVSVTAIASQISM